MVSVRHFTEIRRRAAFEIKAEAAPGLPLTMYRRNLRVLIQV